MTIVMIPQVVPDPSPAADTSARPLVLTPATDADSAAVLAMVARCSRTAVYRRFHGFTDGFAYTRDALRSSIGDTVVAWAGSNCVGMATVGFDVDQVAHLGVLVEDNWQRHGVGRRLIETVIDRARAAGVESVHADVLGDASFLLELLRPFGPMAVAIERGTYSVEIDIRAQP